MNRISIGTLPTIKVSNIEINDRSFTIFRSFSDSYEKEGVFTMKEKAYERITNFSDSIWFAIHEQN